MQYFSIAYKDEIKDMQSLKKFYVIKALDIIYIFFKIEIL